MSTRRRYALRDASLFAIAGLVTVASTATATPSRVRTEPARVVHTVLDTGASTIDARHLRELMRRGAVLLVDVRDASEYRQGHLPGAVSVPLEKLATRAAALRSSGKVIVTYCHGPSGEKGKCAAEMLRGLGIPRAHALAGGFAIWVDQGYVVEMMPTAG